jgi:hypothetical protein
MRRRKEKLYVPLPSIALLRTCFAVGPRMVTNCESGEQFVAVPVNAIESPGHALFSHG